MPFWISPQLFEDLRSIPPKFKFHLLSMTVLTMIIMVMSTSQMCNDHAIILGLLHGVPAKPTLAKIMNVLYTHPFPLHTHKMTADSLACMSNSLWWQLGHLFLYLYDYVGVVSSKFVPMKSETPIFTLL